MTENMVSLRLKEAGIEHESISEIPEGSNHYIYDVATPSGRSLIVRVQKSRRMSKDSLFGGELSTCREVANMQLLKERGVPVPEVEHATEDYIVVSKLPGMHWSDFLEKHGHSREKWLSSMRHLGMCVAVKHTIVGRCFGDAVGSHVQSDCHSSSSRLFSQRVKAILDHRLKDASKVYSNAELVNIRAFFSERLSILVEETAQSAPVFCLTDMHGMNFLVDSSGRPTGFFDLETCQYAHPALEMYGIRLFLMNYYDHSHTAEKAFIEGYREAGGEYGFTYRENIFWENTLGLLRLLEFSVSYHGVKDGLRNSWSGRFKALLESGMESGCMPWRETALILAEKTGQPEQAY